MQTAAAQGLHTLLPRNLQLFLRTQFAQTVLNSTSLIQSLTSIWLSFCFGCSTPS